METARKYGIRVSVVLTALSFTPLQWILFSCRLFQGTYHQDDRYIYARLTTLVYQDIFIIRQIHFTYPHCRKPNR